jgi:predicted dehydrogenase
MSSPLSRRRFLELTTASAAGLSLAGCASLPKQRITPGRLRHAGIGVGGMGGADLGQIAGHGEVEVVALCDVDRGFLEAAAETYPDAKLYTDWRELFREQGDALDSCHVTTPDHMHAPIMHAALQRRIHVYGQKPLTRTVAEARSIARAADRARVVTQMGIQNHSNQPYAQAFQLFRAGHVGEVYEVHVWTDRPAGWWPQGCDRQEGEDEVPETLDWDKWLGVAPWRPYKEGQYHPFAWRGWKDFGTGAQGDMGCHLMDPALWFLELGHPSRIRSDGPTPNHETYPNWSRVDYEFPATRFTTAGPLRLTWHDGGKMAYRELLDEIGAPEEMWKNACLFLGTKGALLASPYQPPLLLPTERYEVEMPEPETPNHWHQWVDACRGQAAATAPFDYSALLTEVVLLGNVALHHPHETLEWDGPRLRFADRHPANALLSSPPRAGWEA